MKSLIDGLDKMIAKPVTELDYQDDYTLLISIMLSAQTTDKKVNDISPELFENYPNPDSIKEEDYEKIESIIRPLGLSKTKANNIIKIASLIKEQFGGKIPSTYEDLIKLPGIGNKTAKVFLVEFYKQNYFPVDTHVKRVATRLGKVNEKDSPEVVEKKMSQFFKNIDLAKRHQQFVLHGRYTCVARKPKCEQCSLTSLCKYYKESF
ncbi:TPA: endonuclease III [bacterium]|nr:endonuclease III [bacterium]